MDEMWSFVGSKENKAWIGLAMDEATREIVGFDLGDRTRAGAWGYGSLCPLSTAHAPRAIQTFGRPMSQSCLSLRHGSVGKNTGQTNYIERFNNTLRRRVGRLLRQSLSFSKKLSNHIGAIWYFIHCYNAALTI